MNTIKKSGHFPLEKLNSLSHGIGILFGIVCIPLLIAVASRTGNPVCIAGSAIYGFCFLMLFTFSTLYHAYQEPKLKERLKILDHISIYFLIAGTYTPLIIIFVNNNFGYLLLVVLWSLTLVGAFFKLFYTGRFEIVSTIIYLLMGWILFAGGNSFFEKMPAFIISLIVIGGALYTVGVVFFLWQRYKYHHAVWHLFVLAAAICHYAAIFMAIEFIPAL